MCKYFTVAQIDNDRYKYVSLSLSYEGIDYFYQDLEKELNHNNVKGLILLDLLLSNGCNSERFVSIYFNGDKFDFDTYKIEKSIDNSVEAYCSKYYRENSHLIDNSVLTSPQKFLFKRNKLKIRTSC